MWRERTACIAATTLLLIALAFAASWRQPVVSTGDVVRFSVNPPDRMTFTEHAVATVPAPQFALSPDGRWIAFVATAPGLTPTLWLRSWEDVVAKVLPGTESASEPFWSPDSRWMRTSTNWAG